MPRAPNGGRGRRGASIFHSGNDADWHDLPIRCGAQSFLINDGIHAKSSPCPWLLGRCCSATVRIDLVIWSSLFDHRVVSCSIIGCQMTISI